jgi:curved DNA-binding protein
MLRIPSTGARGPGGGPNGDLYLTINVAQHPDYQRKGNDLSRALPVELYTAMLGGKTQIQTWKGKITVNIPKGTANGKELRLRGLGMPVYGKKGKFGDMLVKVDVVLPEQLGTEESDLFGQLASMRK